MFCFNTSKVIPSAPDVMNMMVPVAGVMGVVVKEEGCCVDLRFQGKLKLPPQMLDSVMEEHFHQRFRSQPRRMLLETRASLPTYCLLGLSNNCNKKTVMLKTS